MLVAAAVCPHPPLLVPGVGAGATDELADLRSACDAAVQRLLAAPHDLLVVVGDAPRVGPYPESAWGSLRPLGVPVEIASGPGEASLPLALTLGRWLIGRTAPHAIPLAFGVSADCSSDRAGEIGAALAGRAERVAMLVMGDGSARRSAKGPGYVDPRAQGYDDAAALALRAGDVTGLRALDAGLGAELLVAGRAARARAVGGGGRPVPAGGPQHRG